MNKAQKKAEVKKLLTPLERDCFIVGVHYEGTDVVKVDEVISLEDWDKLPENKILVCFVKKLPIVD